MKKTKAVVSLILSFALIFSTVEMLKISAATSNTQRSEKYLMNGSFEEDVDQSKFNNGYRIFSHKEVGYWHTTATDGQLEFFNNGTQYHFKSSNETAYKQVADGEIAAELNANQEATIYQKIVTVAGSTYTWGLYHRGRELTDRMVLIIGPEQTVDPIKPSLTGKDQFIRITDWLKTQYGIDYPETGCSQKYTVYSRPFAANGNFEGNNSDDNENISMVATDDINQEWSVWVISSPKCDTTEGNVKGWSSYGTRATDDFDEIMKGAGSKLGYDCTYTVPSGQENTMFAFCSYSSGTATSQNASYGNLLDGIEFKLYQPVSSSITDGGIGSPNISNIIIDSDNSFHDIVIDESYYTVYTKNFDTEIYEGCKFIGAYVTKNFSDGTSSYTKFIKPYTGDISNLTEEELKELSTQYFIPMNDTDPESGEWQYYYSVSVESPVSIHMIYTMAPFVLYDSNGGQDYFFSTDNIIGGNLVGFADYFQKVPDKIVDGEQTYVNTSGYYSNFKNILDEEGKPVLDEEGKPVIEPGKYISHAALPNESWGKDENGTSPHKFCGWSLTNNKGKQVIIPAVHKVVYDPTETENSGMVTFTDLKGNPLKDSEGNDIGELTLDASNGITLTALWKFVNRAQAQTYNEETEEFINSAVGGTVQETLMSADKDKKSNITDYTDDEGRVEYVDAAGDVGDKIMFKAIPDSANNYAFTGWYCKNKETGKYELKNTSTSIAVTIEEGIFNTYYARFQLKTVPVIFNYTETGNPDNYYYYLKSTDDKYGKYFQNVFFRENAVKPNDETLPVKTWYTSKTERGTEYIFDFNTPITEETNLYAGPSFTYNYFNYFKLKEPWYINTYGTLKFDGNYIDLKNDADVTDYNVYMLKDTSGNTTAPSPSEIKGNSATIKIGKSVNSDKLIFNSTTSTNQTFNRAGAVFDDFYLFNMDTPVWVVFDFTYQGITYTSTVKNRSLYNCITTYMDDNNKLYTNYPPEAQADLRKAQKELLYSIQDMNAKYKEVSQSEIIKPSDYAQASSVSSGLTYDPTTENPYTFNSSTAIRNIEPWGLKYSFTVTDNTVTDFPDYGAVVLTDKDGTLNADTLSVQDMLDNENSVMYSKSNDNVYSYTNDNDVVSVEIYYVNNMLASDFDKNTYAVFFVKDSDGKYYYSNIVNNSYTTLASKDTSEYKDVSASIITYSENLKTYCKLIDNLNSGKQ